MPVLAAEHQARPGRAAFLVLRPLHLVEHERLTVKWSHLRRAADDRRVGIDALLAGDEADALLAELGGEPAVRLLREHPQRRRVDAAAVLDEEPQRVVRLPGVRRSEMGDHRLRLDSSAAAAGRSARRPASGRLPRRMAIAPARPLLPLVAPGHAGHGSWRPGSHRASARGREHAKRRLERLVAERRADRRRRGSPARRRCPRCSVPPASYSGRSSARAPRRCRADRSTGRAPCRTSARRRASRAGCPEALQRRSPRSSRCSGRRARRGGAASRLARRRDRPRAGCARRERDDDALLQEERRHGHGLVEQAARVLAKIEDEPDRRPGAASLRFAGAAPPPSPPGTTRAGGRPTAAPHTRGASDSAIGACTVAAPDVDVDAFVSAREHEANVRAARAEDPRDRGREVEATCCDSADAHDRVAWANARALRRSRLQRDDDEPARRGQHAHADAGVPRRGRLPEQRVVDRREIGGVRIAERRDHPVDRSELEHRRRHGPVVPRRESLTHLVDDRDRVWSPGRPATAGSRSRTALQPRGRPSGRRVQRRMWIAVSIRPKRAPA